jgi:hypothetical protein
MFSLILEGAMNIQKAYIYCLAIGLTMATNIVCASTFYTIVEVCPGSTYTVKETTDKAPENVFSAGLVMDLQQYDELGPRFEQLQMGLDVDARYYISNRWLSGGRASIAREKYTPESAESEEKNGISFTVEPIIGYHKTNNEARSWKDGVGSRDSSGKYCDFDYEVNRTTTHVFAIQPYFSKGEVQNVGAHIVYSFERMTYRTSGITRRDGKRFGEKHMGGWSLAAKYGYIDELGSGYAIRGSYVFSNFPASLSLEYGDYENGKREMFSMGYVF